MRAWMASERAGGLSPRSLARKLSAVKGFIGWLSERDGFDATAVLSTRAPKFSKKLPRPLAEDAARAMIDTVELQSEQKWVAARDAAVLTLLYGCGLRISEALGLKGADFHLDHVVAHGNPVKRAIIRPAFRAVGQAGKGELQILCHRVPRYEKARPRRAKCWYQGPGVGERPPAGNR